MNDLISRRAAIDAVIKRDANCGIDSAEVLKDLPPAQPEIIRCKDCKHMITHEGYGYLGEHAYTCEGNMEGWVLPDSFCSHAERKDGDHDG